MRELPDGPWWRGDPFLAPFPRDLHDTVEELAEPAEQRPSGICYRCGVAGVQGNVCDDPTDCAHRIAEALACLKSVKDSANDGQVVSK